MPRAPKQAESTSAPATIPAESIAIPQDGTLAAMVRRGDADGLISEETLTEFAIAHLVSHYGLPSAKLAEKGLKAALLASQASSRHGDEIAKAIKAGVPVEMSGKTNTGTVARRKALAKGAKLDSYLATLTKETRAARSLAASRVAAAEVLGILAE